MRTLKLILTQGKGALPVLVLATLLPDGGCASTVDTHATSASSTGTTGAGGATGSTSSTSTSAGGGGGFVVSSSTTTTGAGGGVSCEPGTWEHVITVEVPPEGTPAMPGAICSAPSPVESNRAAFVTLAKTSPDLAVADGFIAIDPALMGKVSGLPVIEVTEAQHPELAKMMVANVTAQGAGFSFAASWPKPFAVPPDSWARMTVKVTLQIACDPPGTDLRTVTSITYVHLCLEESDVGWVSSGGDCKTCDIIAEMAPSPIVSDKLFDELPLGRALRLRVSLLARVGRSLVLLAENDGGSGLSYTWAPSSGEIAALAPDVVLWTPAEGAARQMIQAAVHGDDAAAVASFTFREAA